MLRERQFCAEIVRAGNFLFELLSKGFGFSFKTSAAGECARTA
jgi:hypothetical protein